VTEEFDIKIAEVSDEACISLFSNFAVTNKFRIQLGTAKCYKRVSTVKEMISARHTGHAAGDRAGQ
jgi:hypothetical protein